jgi:hypothetical protein
MHKSVLSVQVARPGVLDKLLVNGRQAGSNPLTGSQLSGSLGVPAMDVRNLWVTSCTGGRPVRQRCPRDTG